jgi:hypothetical protein
MGSIWDGDATVLGQVDDPRPVKWQVSDCSQLETRKNAPQTRCRSGEESLTYLPWSLLKSSRSIFDRHEISLVLRKKENKPALYRRCHDRTSLHELKKLLSISCVSDAGSQRSEAWLARSPSSRDKSGSGFESFPSDNFGYHQQGRMTNGMIIMKVIRRGW